MTYSVAFRPSARKDIDALPQNVFKRVQVKIDALGANPRPPTCVKLTGHESLYRLRVGDWRVVYAVNDQSRIVTVTVVAHRREIYRGL